MRMSNPLHQRVKQQHSQGPMEYHVNMVTTTSRVRPTFPTPTLTSNRPNSLTRHGPIRRKGQRNSSTQLMLRIRRQPISRVPIKVKPIRRSSHATRFNANVRRTRRHCVVNMRPRSSILRVSRRRIRQLRHLIQKTFNVTIMRQPGQSSHPLIRQISSVLTHVNHSPRSIFKQGSPHRVRSTTIRRVSRVSHPINKDPQRADQPAPNPIQRDHHFTYKCSQRLFHLYHMFPLHQFTRAHNNNVIHRRNRTRTLRFQRVNHDINRTSRRQDVRGQYTTNQFKLHPLDRDTQHSNRNHGHRRGR